VDPEAAEVAPAGDGSVPDRPDARRGVFADAYRRLWTDALRLARLLTGSTLVAEDVAQDAFVGMHRRLHVVDNPDGYIRTAGSPEIDETWDLLCHLGECQRTAIVLRYYLDLPLAEVATALGCPVGTARSTTHRALERLRG
jgi:DNA-directed RNA polymerase specialized sigma24 family protein